MLVEGCKVRQRTQREPEKSISKTTFWWLVETRTSVSLSGHERKNDTYIEKPRRMCSRCILDVAHRIQATKTEGFFVLGARLSVWGPVRGEVRSEESSRSILVRVRRPQRERSEWDSFTNQA